MNSASKNAKEIFLEAIEHHSPNEWPNYLAQATGEDAPLRRRVEILLEAHQSEQSLLDNPAIAPAPIATVDQPFAELAGTQIGPYKLLQQIGEGGMGTVYMAEQSHPVQRKVALKVIKAGMDSGQVIARFEAERQALALMDHPNIAKVLDAGTTAAGRPYFVMELVKGVPITAYCDENHLPPKARLELFTQVCNAVQHAHQKGIIHRDIKPTNVLVTLYDDKPVPKVIDFGVAKATGSRLTERTMFTGYGQIVGTVEYMSPEQARLNALDVDTRGDIYSLGVLLYELLTGTTPFYKKHLREAAFDEMLRMIREDEPPKPSTRLSTSEGRASIAANRSMEPNKLSGLVRGELDWIVMKALEKDRNRRYETANGFAADVLHYLADEPVQACPPSAAYRFRKFARRNKAAIATGGLVSAALVAAVVILAVSNVLVTRERNAKDTALAEKVQALGEKQTALGEKQAALTQSQANFVEAKRQEGLAREQEQIATEQTALAKLRLYASQMNLAMQAWRAGDAPRALELLESQRPKADEDDLRGFEWFYLYRLCNGGRIHLKGHADGVLSLSYSPDGKTLASTGSDEIIRLWDTATGRERMMLRGHATAPWDVAFSPDGTILASGGKETSEVILWNATTGQPIHTIPATVDRLAFSPDGKTLLGGGLATRLWDVASGEERAAFPEEAGVMVGMFPDGKTVVTLAAPFSDNCEVRFWDVDSGARKLTIPFHGLHDAALSPDGARLATTGWKSVRVWDTATGQQQSSYSTQSDMRGVAFSPDGKKLAAAEGRCAAVWDLETGDRLGQDVHRDVVWAVAFSPDSQTVASATLGGDIKLWDMTPPEEAASIAIQGMKELRFSPDGRTLLVGNPGLTSIVDVSSGKEVAVLPFSGASAFSADGATAARLAGDTPAIVWDATSGRELAHLPLQPRNGGTPGITLSADGKHAATFVSWRDDTVKLWDVATQQVRTLTNDVGQIGVNCAEFSPDGKLLAAGFDFQWVVVWDVATGKVKLQFRQQPKMMWIKSLRFSPDSKALAVGTDIGAVTLWDMESGQRLADFRGHTSNVDALAFSPDGKVLATAGEDKTVKLWDTRTAQERSTLTGHTGRVWKVLFSPDGNTLATASLFPDGTVRLWRAATDPEALARRGARSAPGSERSSGRSAPSLALPPTAFELTEAGLRDAVRRWPDEVALHRRLGQLLVEQRRPAEAEPALQEVVRLNPNAEDDYCTLAEVLRQQQKFAEAETALREAIRLNPTRPWTHDGLGRLLMQQQKFVEAESAFRELVRLRPDLPGAHIGLGNALREQKKFREALVPLRAAVRLDASSYWAHYYLGWSLFALEQFADAEVEFREVTRLMPEFTPGHYRFGCALLRQKKLPEAIGAFREAIRLDPSNPQWHDALGGTLVEQAEFTQAELEYREVIRLKPDYAGGHFGLGRSLVEQDKFSDAEAAVREGLRLEQTSDWGLGLLNRALVGQGKRPEAEQPEMNDP